MNNILTHATHEAILREAGYEKKSEGKYQKTGGFGFILRYFETDAEERKHIMCLHPDERKEFTLISTVDIYEQSAKFCMYQSMRFPSHQKIPARLRYLRTTEDDYDSVISLIARGWKHE